MRRTSGLHQRKVLARNKRQRARAQELRIGAQWNRLVKSHLAKAKIRRSQEKVSRQARQSRQRAWLANRRQSQRREHARQGAQRAQLKARRARQRQASRARSGRTLNG
jgi:hypothetical protein